MTTTIPVMGPAWGLCLGVYPAYKDSCMQGLIIAKTREQIAKLQEYRSALISAEVTGKIDVRGAPG